MGKLIGIAVSLVVLGLIYWQIDLRALLSTLVASDPWLLLVAAALTIPATLLSAGRLCWLMPGGNGLRIGEAARLILMAAVLNLVLPSKMGDLAKAYALTERGHARGSDAVAVVLLEKAMDMAAMLLLCAVGLALAWPEAPITQGLAVVAAAILALCVLALISPGFGCALLRTLGALAPRRFRPKLDALAQAWRGTVGDLWRQPTRAASIILASLASWLVQLGQIWLFALALGAAVPFAANLALAPLAILVGLLPFTLAGIGTRDAALIVLYQPYMAAPAAAALGLLCTLRYLLPALAGLPLLAEYLAVVRRTRTERLAQRKAGA
jgi:glycosyltransferase 2 family protein